MGKEGCAILLVALIFVGCQPPPPETTMVVWDKMGDTGYYEIYASKDAMNWRLIAVTQNCEYEILRDEFIGIRYLSETDTSLVVGQMRIVHGERVKLN